MRINKSKKFENISPIEIVKLSNIPEPDLDIVIITEKEKIKLIKTIEKIVRTSLEYKQYIQFLREHIDMNYCAFFTNIDRTKGRRVSIEIHHEPFTLFDIVQTILTKYEIEGMKINIFDISEEIVKLHYQNMIGLIPLSVTVHELVTNGNLFISLQYLYGDFIYFLEEYDKYIHDDLKNILERKLELSKKPENCDMSILQKKFLYLEVNNVEKVKMIEEKRRDI